MGRSAERAKANVNPLKIIIVLFVFHVALFFYAPDTRASVEVTLSVEGVDGELKENVFAYLSIELYKEHPDLTENRLEKLHRKADEEIRQALQPFGYYNSEIRSSLENRDSRWRAHYIISPGPPVLVDKSEILLSGEGAEDKKFKALLKKFPLRKGDILNHQLYEQGKRSFHGLAEELGYLAASMETSRVDVNVQENRADIIIHFRTGPRYYFGEVRFVQDSFSQEFVERFVPFRKGQPYTLSALLKFQRDLNDSDYFESVDVTREIDIAEGLEVPVTVRLVPRKKNKYAFGLGYGTDTGFRGSAGWENRRLNRKGHRLKTLLRASEIKSSATAEYIVPLKKPRTESIVYSAGWAMEDTETSESEKIFIGIRHNHTRYGWNETVYVNYEQEDFEVGDDSGNSTFLIPGISWTRIRADRPLSVRRGSRIFLDMKGAHEGAISETSFLQGLTQIKLIRGITPRGRLIMRGEGGTTSADEFLKLPASLRFFAGGDHSVRGYTYKSLGPEDDEGNVIGGRHYLAGSIEYEHIIKGNWSAAVFYDTGNAINSLSDPLKQGAGFGIRWKSPVGPIRVDLAFPLSESDDPWRIHLNVGPDL